ncbi:MAG: glycosyltransferase WbuB [Proteobacteria bacterium]|nr:MAG: glycosyltransferase WbuB [Pseudomonadota bacterium]
MNILCVSKYASPMKYGKMPSRLFYLASNFGKLGHDVTLITSDANHLADYPQSDKRYNFECINGVQIVWIKTKKYTKTASISRVLSWFDFERWLFRFKIDKIQKPDVIIISSLSIFTIIYGYFLKRKFGSFLVFEIRDIWPLTMTEEGGFSKWNPLVLLIAWVEKFGYKKADLVVGTMPRLDLHVKDILGYEKAFFCSPFGFEPKNYESQVFKVKNPFDDIFPKDKIIIGYAGSMGITNALEPFMKSIYLLKDNDKIHFMLVGSGDLKEGFQRNLSSCKNVSFLPRIKHDEVKYFLDKCDILYLSTQHSKVWRYGQSMNKVVEYMLSSKPIIASYSGYPSMINEANCGYFVSSDDPYDLKNAFLELANMDEKKRKAMGYNGKKWIYENRQYEKLAQDYLKQFIKKKDSF